MLGPVGFEQARAVHMAHDLGPHARPHGVAIGVVAMVVGVEHIFDRLVGGFADGGHHILRLLGEIGVDHHHVVLEDHPDVVAAAERDGHVGGADGCVAEKDPRGHFHHIVELHSRDLFFLYCLNCPADPCCQNAAGNGHGCHQPLRDATHWGFSDASTLGPCPVSDAWNPA